MNKEACCQLTLCSLYAYHRSHGSMTDDEKIKAQRLAVTGAWGVSDGGSRRIRKVDRRCRAEFRATERNPARLCSASRVIPGQILVTSPNSAQRHTPCIHLSPSTHLVLVVDNSGESLIYNALKTCYCHREGPWPSRPQPRRRGRHLERMVSSEPRLGFPALTRAMPTGNSQIRM